MIVERTVRPGHGLERLVGCAEGGRQRVEIGLFGNRIGSDQDPVGAKTDRLRPALRGGENAARQQIAQAREFRAEARRRGSRQALPNPAENCTRQFDFHASGGCPNADTERHRRPHDSQSSRARSTCPTRGTRRGPAC